MLYHIITLYRLYNIAYNIPTVDNKCIIHTNIKNFVIITNIKVYIYGIHIYHD